MKQNQRPILMVLASMVIFGTIGIFRRFIPLGSATLAMVRGFVGSGFLLVYLAARKQKLNREAIWERLPLLILSGAFLGFNWILLFEAYNYTTVAVATLCYYMAPIIIILVSPFVVGERLTAKKLVCVAVALLGMVLVSGVLDAGSGDVSFQGVFYGLCAAVLYASVVFMNKKIGTMPAYDKTIVQLGSAALVLLPYVLVTERPDPAVLTPFAMWMVLVVGVLHTGLAYALYFGSMDKLPAQTLALMAYADPVLAVILSALVLGEKMGPLEMVGTVCIIGATITSEFPEKER